MTQYVAYVVVCVFIDEWMGVGGEERERDTDILLKKGFMKQLHAMHSDIFL